MIENCIFGVDIQPIAVQISKLRFFISLVAEQKPIPNAAINFGIRPLPNLEAKFIAANSLMPLDKLGNLLTAIDDLKVLRDELAETNHKLFRAKRNAEKRKLREKIKEIRHAYATALKNNGSFGDESAEMLAEWNMFDQNHASPFFDAEWMFDIGNGFDIVIANPPYVEAKKLKNVVAPFKDKYLLSSGTADLSIYFFEAAFNNLVPNGVLSFITTNKFFSTGYGKKLRQHLINNTLSKIINFEQVEVFENVLVSSVIVEAIKLKAPLSYEFTYEKFYQLNYTEFRKQFVSRIGLFGRYDRKNLSEKEWSFADQNGLALKSKIESNSCPLSSLDGVNVFRGVTTGYNPAFIVNEEILTDLISQDQDVRSIGKKLLQGRNIRRWYYNAQDENLLFIPWHFPLHKDESITGASLLAEQQFQLEHSHLYSWFEKHKEELSQRNQEETGIRYEWYALQRCAASYYSHFEYAEKIIWGLTADKWAFTLDNKQHYLPSNGYILTSGNIPPKYILGLLNSKLMCHYFSYIGVMTAGGAYTLKAATIESLPFKVADNTTFVVEKVSQILQIKEADNNADVSQIENEIDLYVYKLYHLIYDEILLIDPETTITHEEYENFSV